MKTERLIEISGPAFLGRELDYVSDTFAQRRLSMGPYVARFAEMLESRLGVSHAVPVSSGTAALHISLLALGVRPGDHVVMPACSYIATANAVRYCRAIPVFVDVDPETWTMVAADAERAIELWHAAAVITVDLYGVPCERPRGASVLQDACESHGAPISGDVAVLSFYGNKIITTGEGGAVLTNDSGIAERAKLLRGQGTTGKTRYFHETLGFNYRMTDLQAAVGCGQLEEIREHLHRRALLRKMYERLLPTTVVRQRRAPGSVDWVMPVLVENRDRVARVLLENYGIETRPVFPPLFSQPGYESAARYSATDFAVSRKLAEQGLLLPLHLGLTASDIAWICNSLRAVLEEAA